VKEILNIDNITVEEKCLGLPMPEGQMKKEKFMAMKERLTKGFTNWAEKYILVGAKEVLIKSVAQAIPANIHYGVL
jgi:hypothetical protein